MYAAILFTHLTSEQNKKKNKKMHLMLKLHEKQGK